MIDIEFDTRLDSGGGDPDSRSAMLRSFHLRLWHKPLPGGEMLDLDGSDPRSYITAKANGQSFRMSSDSIVNSHRGPCKDFYAAMGDESNGRFHRIGRTVGGSILFPGYKVDGHQTINQRRGTHPHVRDRVDLTLECIRRHYDGNLRSPLSQTLERYGDFFALFQSFEGYTSFFLLQDLVDTDGSVRFLMPFRQFGEHVLPESLTEYSSYRTSEEEFVLARGARIAAWDASEPKG